MTLDTEGWMNGGTYPETKVNVMKLKVVVVVIMTSANGKIPAGSINFKLAENNSLLNYELEEYPIEKCPDKTAKVEMSMNL